jgi:hypothetical protein
MKSIYAAILAVCLGALGSVSALAQNTSYGTGSLASDTTGYINSAFGYYALDSNTTGYANTAVGSASLLYNTVGYANTATGTDSLLENTSGNYNTADGYAALFGNSSGSSNTAVGAYSLVSNTTGGYNAAFGGDSLYANTTGNENSSFGWGSLNENTTGYQNTAVGLYSLQSNTTGDRNIAIGYAAGGYLANNASNNIDIGSGGASSDNGVIRIGGDQSAFFAGGVRGVQTGLSNAVEVMIDGNGQLGTINSSLRFKEDVHDMAAASDGLMQLRPVTYRYKQAYADGSKPMDYGLIAEEVAKIYPDLVARDASGQIQTVQYQKLTPMLLNEVQKEHQRLEAQEKTIQLLEKRLAALEAVQSSTGSNAQFANK